MALFLLATPCFILGLVAGWGWLAGASGIGVLGAAAIVAGRDSRASGDWFL